VNPYLAFFYKNSYLTTRKFLLKTFFSQLHFASRPITAVLKQWGSTQTSNFWGTSRSPP